MILSLDIGGTEIKYATIDKKILQQGKISTSLIDSKESFYTIIENICHQFEKIEGVALSMPGIIDSKKGLIELVVVFPYLSKVNIKEELESRLHLPVSVENDAKCAALCEARIGGAKDMNDAIVVVFGTGIGGSIIKDGKIHHGHHLLAGEISTVIMREDGKDFSDLCSTKNICRQVAEAKGLEKINGIEIYQLIRQGDQTVIDIMNQAYHNIAVQLYNFQYIYDPEIILIGGGISKEPLFIEGIQKAIDEMSEKQIIVPKIDTCKYYNDANLYGAYHHYLDTH